MTVPPEAEAKSTVSPVIPRTPGAAIGAAETESAQLPDVFHEALLAEFHSACPEIVTVAELTSEPLVAWMVAVPGAYAGV